MRAIGLALLALSCGPGEPPTLGPSISLFAEPTLIATGETRVENHWSRDDLVVSDIDIRPGGVPAQWEGQSEEWRIAPGEGRDITLHFWPQTEGTWDGELVVLTDAGDLSIGIHLVAEVGTDADNDGWSAAMGDCDDLRTDVFPESTELCDGVDQDCDDEIDEGFDADGDGHRDAVACDDGTDCDDGDAEVFPGAVETCDYEDEDCNGAEDDIQILADDQDGVCAGALKHCVGSTPTDPDYTDLPDYEPVELTCDGLDNDCDGVADQMDARADGTSDCTDDDGDTFSEGDGDCDDTTTSITPDDCGAIGLLALSYTDGYARVLLDVLGQQNVSTDSGLYIGIAEGADAWIADRDGQRLLRFDLGTGTVVDDYELTSDVWGLVGDLDANELFALEAGGDVDPFTADTLDLGSIVDTGATEATGLTLDESDGTLWICTSEGHAFHVDPDAKTSVEINTFADCYGRPVVDAANNRVLVPGYTLNRIAVIDRSDESFVEIVDLSEHALRLVLAEDRLYVVTGVDDDILVLDPITLEETAVWDVGAQVQDLWPDPVRGDVWVTLYGADAVHRLDPVDGSVRSTFSVTDPVGLVPVY